MKVLIAYGSRLGATEGIAERIGEVLRADGLTVSVQPAAGAGPIEDYEAAIVGGGIYAGHWHKSVKEFVDDNAGALGNMPVWLFSSGPVGQRATESVPIDAVEVAGMAARIHARGHTVFLGALDRSRVDTSDLSGLERLVTRTFLPQGDWRDWSTIEAWAHAIARELISAPLREPVATSI
jgi:menaquinone-dependent protoporphyrinogen oxidase